MDERSEGDKMDEIMLPGFRFHPTDEELVGFYLRRKIQQQPLSIELIKEVDIYKYDPWDLPTLATSGEKEWYFYCQRDRKYRNSSRPNRVTRAGFWKATGTDRFIYSTEGSTSKCIIGLKKSLVFYNGRAAKGTKTDWMMHEFRLPSITDNVLPKRFMDKSITTNDSWAICRIFKKANSTTKRTLSQSWVSPLPESTVTQNMPLTTKTSSSTEFELNNVLCPLDIPLNKPINKIREEFPTNCSIFSSSAAYEPTRCFGDASSLLLNMSSSIFGNFNKASRFTVDYSGLQEQFNFPFNAQLEMKGKLLDHEEETDLGAMGSNEFPFSWPLSSPDAWKSSLLWDSSPSLIEMSTDYSTNKG